MAVLWQRHQNNTKYEIRTAGATKRLYKNGVCHSQYNPNRILTGSVWDLLLIPSFLLSKTSSLRILVLGVGGGAVLRLMDEFFPDSEIFGIELDPMHIYLSKRFFDIKKKNMHVFEADAKDWVERYQGEAFDIVIEDLFFEEKKQPVRAVDATSRWYNQLLALLHSEGMLIMNFASLNEFRHSSAVRVKQINHKFNSIFQLTTPMLDNVIGVYSSSTLQTEDLHKALIRNDAIRKAIETKYLRYRVRKLRKL